MRQVEEGHLSIHKPANATLDSEALILNVKKRFVWVIIQLSATLQSIIYFESFKKSFDPKEKQEAIKKIPKPSFALCLGNIFIFKFSGILGIKIAHDLLNFAKPILLE